MLKHEFAATNGMGSLNGLKAFMCLALAVLILVQGVLGFVITENHHLEDFVCKMRIM